VIAARDPERLAAAIESLRTDRRDPHQVLEAVRLDVSDPHAVDGGVRQAIEALGGLDVLVNNAGVALAARFLETPLADFERLMQTNYLGMVRVTRAAIPALVPQGSGHVVNVSSLAGLIGIYGYTAYAASKFAVVGFSQALRQETPQLAEENLTKPDETRAIAGTVRTLSAETVAAALLDGVARRRFLVVPGLEARWTERLARHLPGLARRVMDRPLRARP
jgi:3-dehydrosphinganine reductase